MIFKEINSETIRGLIICKEPPISSPSKRINEITIDGKNGTIVEELGYKSYTKAVEIGLTQNANVNDILSYFSGSGHLTFNCESDKYYKASIYSKIDLDKLLRYRTGKIEFYCQPFKYDIDDKFEVVTNSIINGGNIYSEPIIRLEKQTESVIDVAINNVRFKYTFNTNDTYAEIDCEEMNAEFEGLNRNRNLEIGFDFPRLEVGTNAIIRHDGDATIKIKRRNRWL